MKTENWNEFRETGLLTFVNCFLHIFGWCIALEMDEDKITNVYPMKVNYSGFPQESMDRAYDRIHRYLQVKEEEEVEEDPPSKEELEEVKKINESSEKIIEILKNLEQEKKFNGTGEKSF